jgi:tRNA nucleotidyltransferase (CCA-adding enzyme)
VKTKNLAKLLKDSLSADQLRLLELVREEASREGRPLYLVGGSVRDLVLGRRLNDFDLIVEGDAIPLARSLAARYGGEVTAHTRFRTAKWFLPEKLRTDHPFLDLISARSETYKHPAALPTVKPGDIAADVRRRDFTINALALRLDGPHFGELRDDLGGREDLEKGIVRVLHSQSFVDDPTRMYRAVRYEGRYGFQIADETLALIPGALAIADQLSPYRIRHELDLVLEEPNARAILRRLDELGLLGAIHPALTRFEKSRLANLESNEPALQTRNARWVTWLMHLKEQEIEFINKRLHFSADLLKVLRSASLLHANLSALTGLKPSDAVEMLEGYSFKALEVMSVALEDSEARQVLAQYIADWWHLKPRTTGHDLMKRGIAPGPRYAEILRRLRAAWLDGEVKTEQEERKLLDRLSK